MNWQEIKEKYPNSTNLMDKQFSLIYTILQAKNDNRILYDFFDEQGIYVDADVSYTNEGDVWFEYEITILQNGKYKNDYCSLDEPDYCEPYKTKTRTEAEEQAFMKAFEILEEKIK